jgi:uncharacterized protein YhfF
MTLKPLSQSVSILLGNEGEGDRTREWWLDDAHRHYFSRQASQDGFEFEDDIPTVFERFEVVWPVDIAERITGRSSSDELIERGEPSSS